MVDQKELSSEFLSKQKSWDCTPTWGQIQVCKEKNSCFLCRNLVAVISLFNIWSSLYRNPSHRGRFRKTPQTVRVWLSLLQTSLLSAFDCIYYNNKAESLLIQIVCYPFHLRDLTWGLVSRRFEVSIWWVNKKKDESRIENEELWGHVTVTLINHKADLKVKVKKKERKMKYMFLRIHDRGFLIPAGKVTWPQRLS